MSRSRPEAAAPAQRARSPGRAEAMLHRLDWTVLRRLDGALQGDYRSLFRGTGLDLADLREYQHHDDPRHIDWNVTARLQVPHVRQYTEDRDVTAWFLVDLSPSVGFGSTRSKHDVAVEFTMLLARLLTRRGNRVGALLYGDRVDTVVPARGGRVQVLELAHRMLHRPPRQPMPGARNWPRCFATRWTRCAAARSCSSSPTSSARPAGTRRWGSWPRATR